MGLRNECKNEGQVSLTLTSNLWHFPIRYRTAVLMSVCPLWSVTACWRLPEAGSLYWNQHRGQWLAFSISGLHAGSDSTLLPDFPSQLGSWEDIHVPTTKAFLGNESSLLPLTCWLETTSSRPLPGEAQ